MTQTSNDEILFLFLNLHIVPRNSSKWVGITAIKTERTPIHFLSDVLVAVPSLDLKVPTNSKSNEPKHRRHCLGAACLKLKFGGLR